MLGVYRWVESLAEVYRTDPSISFPIARISAYRSTVKLGSYQPPLGLTLRISFYVIFVDQMLLEGTNDIRAKFIDIFVSLI